VGGDLVDLFFGFFFAWLLFGQVQAGDLEAVEEQSCSAGVEVVRGYFLEDDADRGLDGGAVFGEWEVEAGLSAERLAWSWFAGGVVVVAEGFSAQADAAAAMAVGEDVAALVAFSLGCRSLVHFSLSPHLGVLCKVFKSKDISPDFWFTLRLNAKARLVSRACC
jgi:hypothetical protein